MNPIYRFFLQIGENGEKNAVSPNYKDDLSLDYELESNQKFYRAKLSGKISFVRNDFELINNAPFESEFFLYIEKSDDFGITFNEYYKAKFMKTDCTFNLDDKLISVQPETIDQYNDVLAGIEKEYNLVELAPQIEFLTIYKRPLIQIYIPGDSVVSCFLSGMHWEQDVDEPVTDTDVLRLHYYFSIASKLVEINVTGIQGAPADYNGLYVGEVVNGNTSQGILYQGEFRAQGQTNYIRYEKWTQSQGGGEYYLFLDENDNLLYYYQGTGDIETKTVTIPHYQSAAAGALSFDIKLYEVWARNLCDVEKIDNLNTYPIPANDIVENNRNYRRVIGYAIDVARISNNYSDTPTEYGLADNGKYFKPPFSITLQTYYPIAQSTWRYASIWFAFDLSDEVLEQDARKEYTLRDTYTLASCINVLLGKIAPGITHEATQEYSQFLYSEENPITRQKFKLLISQKTNIINGEYQEPAKKAPITLQQIMTMLRDVYKCYWYIENGKFKIEQINWFRNGGSYSYNPIIGYDLTKLQNVRNGKKWGFATSEYSFDKVDMPERYQFSWMDEVTEPFAGLPIEINSKYVTAGKIEEINIGNFTTDIDLMLLNPSAMSSDGFALFAAVAPADGGQLVLPFVRQTVNGIEYIMQNGLLAYINLQPYYWIYDMPARDISINNMQAYVGNISRNKKQTLNFPVGNTEPNPMQLIKTYIGDGQIDKISINLCSRNAETTLKYDTE